MTTVGCLRCGFWYDPAAPLDGAATDARRPSSRAVIADLREDRENRREQAQRLALPKPPEAEPTPADALAAERSRPWWKRLAG